jgi:hypothetical protein
MIIGMKPTSRGARPAISKIVSGGQTGVDRGALEAAIELRIPHGGWCPKGRLAEDGVIPDRYELAETSSPQYRERTERNVLDSDGTLILYRAVLHGGTELTRRLAAAYGKPHLLVDLQQPWDAAALRQWLSDEGIRILNVAGPRESSAPGIQRQAQQLLRELLAAPPE